LPKPTSSIEIANKITFEHFSHVDNFGSKTAVSITFDSREIMLISIHFQNRSSFQKALTFPKSKEFIQT
jgi:hypothetical protein